MLNDHVIAACPACSSPPVREARPEWRYAQRTSAGRGKPCWIWVAQCRHSEAMDPRGIVEDEERAKLEERWADETIRIFDEYTARWTDSQREEWRQRFFENKALQNAEMEPNMVPDETKPNEHDENELPDPLP